MIFTDYAFKKHIEEVLKDFYLCTQMPVKTLSYDGIHIYSQGYSTTMEALFSEYSIIELLRRKLEEIEMDEPVSVSADDKIWFTGFRVCPKTLDRGIHVLGPYMTAPTAGLSPYPYRPTHCIPYLISLVRSISTDSSYIKNLISQFNSYGSLHVNRALKIIDCRYHENLTLDLVTKELEISKTYFCTIFKTETGKTFSQALNEMRVEKSRQLLLNTRLSIMEIALSVGFNNQNYFTMYFKKLTKKTPLEFRNEDLDMRSAI